MFCFFFFWATLIANDILVRATADCIFFYSKANLSKFFFCIVELRKFHPVIPTSNSSLKLIIPRAYWRISVSNKHPSRFFHLTLSNVLHTHLYQGSLQARILHPHIYQTGHLGVLHTNKCWSTALLSSESVLGASTIAESLMKALSLSWIVSFMLGMGMLLRRFMTLPEFRWNMPQRQDHIPFGSLVAGQQNMLCILKGL